jgi:TolA-binding protein
LAVAWLSLHSLFAEEEVLKFIRRLQETGYGDMAVDYLKMLQSSPNIPVQVREVWDLEMSRSLRAASKTAFDAKEAEEWVAQSQKYIEKFIKENPTHPEAVTATFSVGEFAMDRALNLLRAARAIPNKEENKEQKAKVLGEARAALEEARPKFKEASDKYRAKLASLPPVPEKITKRDRRLIEERYDAEMNVLNARFQLALVSYYTAQTYLDPKDPARIAALKDAIKIFDGVYQTRRGSPAGVDPIGLFAHMWHGKATEEMDDFQTALDIYDEVLANTPERGETSDPVMESLFSQVEHFRLLILAKKSPKNFLTEATQWLKEYAKFAKTDGFQGIALEVVKAQLAAAESAAGAEKARLIASTQKLLRDMVKVRSQHQTEAIMLLREHSKSGGGDPTSFDEAVALGDTASAASQWDDAITMYGKALGFGEKSRNKEILERIPAVKEATAAAMYMKARDQFTANKMDDCLATLGMLVKNYPETKVAPTASAMAVTATLNLYVAAPADKKPETLERLIRVANFTATTWPGRPEADEARMKVGEASLVTGKVDEALAVFEKVNPKSERYPNARYLLGRTHWRRYATERAKPEAAQNKELLKTDREKATAALATSLELQRKKLEADQPLPKELIDTQLMLGEINVEGKQWDEAIKLLVPLVDAFKDVKPEEVDLTVLRVLITTLRAYMFSGQLDKATDIAIKLAEVGPENVPAVNGNLIEFARALNNKNKEADAALTEATTANNLQRISEAKTAVAAMKGLLTKYVDKLAGRKLSSQAQVFVANMCADVGLTDKARDIYKTITDRAAQDPAYAKAEAKMLTWVRVQLIGLLAKEGKYEEANKQLTALVNTNPRALPPKIEQGKILQTWAERDPSRYDDAIQHWARLRDLLKGSKKVPPEYYEVVYNLANCLYGQATKATDKEVAKEKAGQAEKLLKSELILHPNLSGPDTVADYNALVQKVATLLGRAAGSAVAPPAPSTTKPAAKP